MGDREWIHPLLLYWHWQRFGGILCAQASPCVPFTAVAWPPARGSGTHAVLYSVNPAMGAGHMGFCPAGICPASGTNGRRMRDRLPVAINTVHMFTVRLLLSAVSVLLLPIVSVLPIFKPTAWCYSSQLIKQSTSYCLFTPCYINHGPQTVFTRNVSDTNIMHDGHRHKRSSPICRLPIAHRLFFLFLHAHPQAVEFLLPIDLLVLRQACVQDVLFVLLIHVLLRRPHVLAHGFILPIAILLRHPSTAGLWAQVM